MINKQKANYKIIGKILNENNCQADTSGVLVKKQDGGDSALGLI